MKKLLSCMCSIPTRHTIHLLKGAVRLLFPTQFIAVTVTLPSLCTGRLQLASSERVELDIITGWSGEQMYNCPESSTTSTRNSVTFCPPVIQDSYNI